MNIHVSVSPSLDPVSIFDGAPDVNSIREAQYAWARVYDKLGSYHEALSAIATDPTLTDAAKVHASEELRKKLTAVVGKQLDHAASRVAFGLDEARKRLAEAVKPDKRNANPKELRDYVRSLPETKRVGFLMKRAAAGDRETIDAVFGGVPAYIAGVEDADFESLKAEAFAKIAPEEAREIGALETVQRRAMNALRIYLDNYEIRRDPRAARH